MFLPSAEKHRMVNGGSSKKQIITYLVSVFLFSSFFYFLILRSGSLRSGGGLYVRGLMWCPALAAFLTMRLNRRKLSELGWHWGEYQFRSWLIPLLYALIAYGVVWLTGLGAFGNPEFARHAGEVLGLAVPSWVAVSLNVLLTCSFGLIGSLASALGEEIGWRGFLVPELARNLNFTATAFVSGIVWSLWHYPILIWGDYNAGTPAWYGLTCFTVMVVGDSFIFAWMRLKSGSLWTGTMLHASHNLFVQTIFTPLTRNTGKTAWFIDEFGAILPVVVVLFAIYFWRRRNQLPSAIDRRRVGSPLTAIEAGARA